MGFQKYFSKNFDVYNYEKKCIMIIKKKNDKNTKNYN